MDSSYEAAAEVRDGLYKIAGGLQDVVDAVLTLAVIQAMGGGLQDAAAARTEVFALFNGMREEE